MESVIKWRTGMPKEAGRYLVTLKDGTISIDNLIDWDGKSDAITLLKYTDDKIAKEDKVYDDPALMRTPIVRNGKLATVGYCPEIWATWE